MGTSLRQNLPKIILNAKITFMLYKKNLPQDLFCVRGSTPIRTVMLFVLHANIQYLPKFWIFEDLTNLKNEYCIYSKLCEILFDPKDVVNVTSAIDEHFIEVLDCKKQSVSVVHPSMEVLKQSGVIVVNNRSLKPKCHTCKGFKCLHVNIYLEKAAEQNNEKTTSSKRLIAKNKTNII